MHPLLSPFLPSHVRPATEPARLPHSWVGLKSPHVLHRHDCERVRGGGCGHCPRRHPGWIVSRGTVNPRARALCVRHNWYEGCFFRVGQEAVRIVLVRAWLFTVCIRGCRLGLGSGLVPIATISHPPSQPVPWTVPEHIIMPEDVVPPSRVEPPTVMNISSVVAHIAGRLMPAPDFDAKRSVV